MGYKTDTRVRAPSNAVAKGTVAGTALGAALDVVLQAVAASHGIALPPGSGAAVGGFLVGIFAYFSKGGRKGEAD